MITMSRSIAEVIRVESGRSADGLETGGILLGHDNGATIHITTAGPPGPSAQRHQDHFLRDLALAQRLGDEAYETDGSVWVGEWHTHPKGPPMPSSRDITTYVSHLANPDLNFRRFVSLIVTPCPKHGWDHVDVAAWIMIDNVLALTAIDIIDDLVEGEEKRR